jgi:predicted phosphoribosyltransferase
VTREEQRELERREREYRHRRALPDLRGWIVVLIDDGLAMLQNIKGAWVEEQEVKVQGDRIVAC